MTEAATAQSEKRKGYITYKKIASFRRGMKATEKGKRSSSSYTLFAFELGDGIVLLSRYRDDKAGQGFHTHFSYKLKLRTNAKGEKRFVFYQMRDSSVRTSNPNHLRSKLAILFRGQEDSRKKPRNIETDTGLCKTQGKRLLIFIRAFLKKHKISFKGLSSDPFSLMIQLCHPGTRSFDESTLLRINTGELLLDDPVKLALRTKGKKSKRLLCEAIKKHPQGALGILRVAKYIRVNRSLDHAQEFLSKIFESREHFADNMYYDYQVAKLKASEISIFDRLSIDEIVNGISSPGILNDTFRMIGMANANAGFDYRQIQYTSIAQLHDQLAQTLPGRRSRTQFKHFEFDTSNLAMKFCESLSQSFSGNNSYDIIYAKDTKELHEHATAMKNCSFCYYSRIHSGNYAIFCIIDKDYKPNQPRYMFGVIVTAIRSKIIAKLEQAVSYCNQKIETSVFEDLNKQIEKALQESASYFWKDCQSYGP
jgi:hypothetical protein